MEPGEKNVQYFDKVPDGYISLEKVWQGPGYYAWDDKAYYYIGKNLLNHLDEIPYLKNSDLMESEMDEMKHIQYLPENPHPNDPGFTCWKGPGFYFWDETQAFCHGPYTILKALAEFERYCSNLTFTTSLKEKLHKVLSSYLETLLDHKDQYKWGVDESSFPDIIEDIITILEGKEDDEMPEAKLVPFLGYHEAEKIDRQLNTLLNTIGISPDNAAEWLKFVRTVKPPALSLNSRHTRLLELRKSSGVNNQ